MVEEEDRVISRVATYLAGREERREQPSVVGAGYDDSDLAILFGGSK